VTEQPQSPESTQDAPVTSPDGSVPPSAPDAGAAMAGDRPEVAVGAAFAGGFLFAMILRRLAR
jgi:hypothetical protein